MGRVEVSEINLPAGRYVVEAFELFGALFIFGIATGNLAELWADSLRERDH